MKMSGRNDFTKLTQEFTPKRRKRVDARKDELRSAMALHELRRAGAMTPKAIGKALNVNQPAVANGRTGDTGHCTEFLTKTRRFIRENATLSGHTKAARFGILRATRSLWALLA